MKSTLPFLPLLLFVAAPMAGMASAMPWFDQVAEEAGIDFTHAGWELAQHNEWFPEITPGGLCWFDYDGDGWQDLYFVTARFYNETLQAQEQPRSQLFRNLGDGQFEDVTDEAGVGLTGRWDMGCSSADYDGDGWEDLFVAGYDRDALLRNRGDGTFEDVTESAGVVDDGLCTNPCWGHSSSWIDYDADGDLDLYVLNYVSWNQTIHTGNGPRQYEGQRNLMWQNQGDGTFLEVSEATNTTDDPQAMHGKGLGAVWFDHDLDGCPDVYIASDQTPASLLRNDCAGHFEDIAHDVWVDDNYSGMGTVAGDTNGDGRYDLYKTHYQGEPNSYYVQRSDGAYDAYTHYGDLRNDIDFVGWGTGFFDFNNDGHQDVYVANGHTEHLLDWYGLTILAWQQNLLWLNTGDGNFTDVTNVTGPGWAPEAASRGSAVADFDLDGDLDLAFNNIGNGTGHLLRNSNVTDSTNWLSLELRQPGANWQAAGARVEATLPSGHTMVRHVMLGSGYLSQDQRALHLGLGDELTADVTVRWPGGEVDQFTAVAANQFLRLEKGGRIVTDTLGPATELELVGTLGDGGWYTAPVQATLQATDFGRGDASGVAQTTWDLGEGWQEYAAPRQLGEGITQMAYRSVDGAGNDERIHRATVRVDASAPSTRAAVTGVAGEANWYVGSTTVDLEADDPLSGVEFTEYNLGAGWLTYEAPLAFEDGVHTLQWRSQDVAGNQEPVQSLTIRVDTLAPATSLEAEGLPGEGSWFVGDAVADAFAHDSGSGTSTTWRRVDNGPWQPHDDSIQLDDGRHVVEAYSQDMAGNVEPVKRLDVNVDQEPPTTQAAVTGGHGREGWFITEATLDLTATDAISGVEDVQVDRGSGWESVSDALVFQDGQHTVRFRSHDVAGNIESEQTINIAVDTVAPVTQASVTGPPGDNGWWLQTVTVDLSAHDQASGVERIQVRVDDHWDTYDGPFELGPGSHWVAFRSIDVAGNVEEEQSLLIQVDDVAPALVVDLAGDAGEAGWFVSNVTVSLSAADTLSGLEHVQYRLAEGSWRAYTEPFVLTEGVHRLEVQATDQAGNVAVQEREILVDTTLPIITMELDGMHLWRGDEVDVVAGTLFKLGSAQDTSGVAWLEYRVDDGPWFHQATFSLTGPDGAQTLSYRAQDVAGNTGRAGTLVAHLQNDQSPTVRLVQPRDSSLYLGGDRLGLPQAAPMVIGGCVPVRAVGYEHVSGVEHLSLLVDGVPVAHWSWDEWTSNRVAESWIWDTLQWLPGPHTVEVQATDHLGNVGRDQAEVWVIGAQSPVAWCNLR